jgi:hypothetical protein
MSKRLSSKAVQTAIRVYAYQEEAIGRCNFEAALGGGLVANTERRGFHLVNAAKEERENHAK